MPSMFVLMGNFRSRAASTSGGDLAALRDDFAALANLIDGYPRIKAAARFVFVPGPSDPGPGPVLPQPPLPAALTKELARLVPGSVFATNPCRIRYYTQEIIVFRCGAQRAAPPRPQPPLAPCRARGLPAAAAHPRSPPPRLNPPLQNPPLNPSATTC